MTAFHCAVVNRSKIPSGSNSTGRKTPKTAGSRKVGEDIAWTGISRCTGDPARMAARMRRHRIHHAHAMPRNPHAQMPHRIAGSGLASGGTAVNTGEETTGTVNG